MLIQKIINLIGSEVQKHTNATNGNVSSLKLAIGKLACQQNFLFRKAEILNDLHKAEFQVFSQWGDDGIINFLINYLDIPNKTFVEFGVESYTECNTRFLLMNDNWSGLVMDGSFPNISKVRNEEIYWRYDLKAVDTFVTAENINGLLSENGFSGEIGLYHIDIDGNDYWVWKNTGVINPIIVIVEYNSIFGFDKPWTVSYDPAFIRSNKHYSNLFYGTSLLSICDLAQEKGYSFIGCNSNGNNAYFVRDDKVGDLKVHTPESGYVLSKFAESRDQNGKLTYLRGDQRIAQIKGLPVYNTRSNTIEEIK